MSSVTHHVQHFSRTDMSDALKEHDGKISVGSRNITNLRFANDIDALAEEEQELEASTKPAQGIRWRSVWRRPN